MSRGKKGSGRPVFDVKGPDVPGWRFSRSYEGGLTSLADKDRTKALEARLRSLNLLRERAKTMEDRGDAAALWRLVKNVGRLGYPTWNEFIAARTETDFLALAYRERRDSGNTAKGSRYVPDARAVAHSVREYVRWQERQGFSPETTRTAESVLLRICLIDDTDGVQIGSRTIVGLSDNDAELILDALSTSARTGADVQESTAAKNVKILVAWLEWELAKEASRARKEKRDPLYRSNVFVTREERLSKPKKTREAAKIGRGTSRRFSPLEADKLEADPSLLASTIASVGRRLGLRSGEHIHLRFGLDVIPMEGDVGYTVLIQGERGRDPRCTCVQCGTPRGWEPKNGSRVYVLNRELDQIGWIAPVCDKLDRWIAATDPAVGALLFGDPDAEGRALTNSKLNRILREAARRSRIPFGMGETGRRTAHSLRHTCGSELLAAGVPHALAAGWIGDTVEEFMKTYGKPTPEEIAKATLTRRTV